MCAVVCVTSVHFWLTWPSVYYKTIILYGGHIEGLGTIGERGLGVVGGRVFDCQLSPVWRQVAVVNTLTGELWSAFVGCWERFRLPPIRCADWTGAITQIAYLIFYPVLRQLQKRLSTLSSAECLSVFFSTNRVDPNRAAPVGAIRSGVTLFTSLFTASSIL